MEPVESFDYKHHRVDIYYDDTDCGNPRDADNLGIMYCEHRNYNLGDMPSQFSSHIPEIDIIREAVREIKDRGYNMNRLERYLRLALGATVVLPLYLYDHSGLSMNTGGFSMCDSHGWDWGMVGIICDSQRTLEYTGASLDSIKRQLENEVEQYNAYLHGSVYGYTVTNIATGIEVDACWGFLVVEEDDMEYMREMARDAA
jgi:hypothetical protein